MNNSLGVGRFNGSQHLFHNVNHLGERKGVVLLNVRLEVHPLDVLHYHVLHSVVFSHVVNPNNVGIIKLGCR